MKTMTKTQYEARFEAEEYPTLNFPKMNEDYLPTEHRDLIGEETIHIRSIEGISYMNTIYRDTNDKIYCESSVEAINRLYKRICRKTGETYEMPSMMAHEDLEYCLYCAEYDFTTAVEKYIERYY